MRNWSFLTLLLLIGSTRCGVGKAADCNIEEGTEITIKENMLIVYNDADTATTAWDGTLQDCCKACCANTTACKQGIFYPTQTVCELDVVVYDSFFGSAPITVFDGCGADGVTCAVSDIEIVSTNNTLSFTNGEGSTNVLDSAWTGTLQDCCNECCSRLNCQAGTYNPTYRNCDLTDFVPDRAFDTPDTIVLSNEICASPPPLMSPPSPAMPPPSVSSPLAPAPPPDKSPESSSPLGIILGSVLGTLAVVLLCGLVAFFLLGKRRSQSTRKPPPDLPVSHLAPLHAAPPMAPPPQAGIEAGSAGSAGHGMPEGNGKVTQGPPASNGHSQGTPGLPASNAAPPHAALPVAPAPAAGIVAGLAEPVDRGAADSHSNATVDGLSQSSLLPNVPRLRLDNPDRSIISTSETRKPLGSTQSTSVSSSLFIQSQVQSQTDDTIASGAAPLDDSPAAFLSAQLDAMHKQGVMLRGRYKLGDRSDRRFGGQGVVQFATHAMHSKKEYAIKFYLNARAFAAEKSVMGNPALEDVMPLVEEVISNDYEPMCMLGRPLPPFVVIEKGESLDSWRARAECDFASAMHILLHVVECAAAMHAAGIVHRDLKPPNIIFYPARNKWNIIDFGAAAQKGSIAPGACTLAYAPPEVVLAMMRGETSWEADPAADVWALGLTAYELLTQTVVFGTSARQTVEETMAGRRQLPWERTDAPDFNTNMRKLAWMKNDILGMLARDPAQRVTLEEVLTSWRSYLRRSSIFEATTTEQADC